MKVSIITPSYNSALYIEKTIASVQSQTIADWEMIIVDDGSTDNSANIVNEIAAIDPRIKLIKKENGGSASARKLGLSLAQGEYIQFLDADDLLDKDKLQFQIRLMEEHSLDISYTDWCWINMNGETTPTRGLYCNLFRLLTIWGPFGTLPPHCFIYKHNYLKKNNINIPTDIKEREDWDFHIEVFSSNPKVQRIVGYCGAMYMKAPTGKTTGASVEKIQLGTFKYLAYKIKKTYGPKQWLLYLRFSIELFLWIIRKIKYKNSISIFSYFSNADFKKVFTIGILYLPLSAIIASISIVYNRINLANANNR